MFAEGTMSEIRLSVVIPTRDTRELTLNCLAALWLCTPQPDEVIVVDDGGTDSTATAVVRKYPRHIVVRLPRNEGFTAAANHGIARASGDIVLLLNSDTQIRPKGLAPLLEAFESTPELGIAGAALRDPSGAPQWSGGPTPSPLWLFALASGIPSLMGRIPVWRRFRSPSGSEGGPVDWVAGTAMAIRRQVWEAVGPFDSEYRFYCQDLDLCMKAVKAGWSIETLPEFEVLHHLGGTISSTGGAVGSSHPELMWSDLLRFAQITWGSGRARKTDRALRLGGRLRLFGRRLVNPLVPDDHKEDWQAATAAYADALRALASSSVRDHSSKTRRG
jgi:GT2 family glycosyltransferase